MHIYLLQIIEYKIVHNANKIQILKIILTIMDIVLKYKHKCMTEVTNG